MIAVIQGVYFFTFFFFGCPGYGKRRAGKDGLFDHRCKKYRYRDSTDVHMYAVYCKTEKKLCLEHK